MFTIGERVILSPDLFETLSPGESAVGTIESIRPDGWYRVRFDDNVVDDFTAEDLERL